MSRTLKVSLLVATLLLANVPGRPGYAQQKPAPTTTPQSAPPLNQPPAFGLQDGTPIKLQIARDLSSADAKAGETVDFEVIEEIKTGETVLIPRGSVAWATVTEAQHKRRLGRGGKLNVNIDTVRLASGEKAPLRAIKDARGNGHVGAMTVGIVATGLVFFPVAPLFLLIKGKDIVIPKGTEITAYINGDIELDPAKFKPGTASSEPVSSSVIIKSTPNGAEITVDDKYVGSTPSTLRLQAGDHVISIKKHAFAEWNRTVTVKPGGSLTIEAALSKKP